MKVLLVNPHYTQDPFTLLLHPPLGYGYLAPALREHGHDVVHADLPFEGNTAEAVVPYLDEFKPDVVGITSVAQSYFHALEIARLVKAHRCEATVVFGGPHPTFIPHECLTRHASVDFVVLYDGEESFPLLVDALQSQGGSSDFEKVPGLSYRDGHAVKVTAPSAILRDLDSLPRVDRSIFDMKRYLRYDYETVIMTARGCPSRCTFCSTAKMGRQFRWHDVPRICDEVEEVLEIGFSSIFFGDDTFSGNRPRILAFCEEIKRRNIQVPWTSNMRALDVAPEVLDAMREAGAYRVFMGFESIQGDALNLMKKGTSFERMYHTAQLVKSHGLELHAAFIVGAPGDTHESLKMTMDYIRLIDPTVATFNVMEPRPGTDVYTNPSRYGLRIPNRYWYETTDWLHAPVCASDALSADEIGAWVHRCYDEFCSPDFRDPARLAPLSPLLEAWRTHQKLPKWAKTEAHQRSLPVLA